MNELTNSLKHNWFEEWFQDEIYLKLYSKRDSVEAEQVINTLKTYIDFKTGSKVLDLACGAGRHAIYLAKLGLDVTAVDLSETLLYHAKKQMESLNLSIKFQLSDMREISYVNEFDFVFQIFTSFGYFEDNNQNIQVLKNVEKALKPYGYYVLDLMNKNFIENNLQPESTKYFDDFKITERRNIINNHVVKEINISSNQVSKIYYESVQLYTKSEIEEMLFISKLEPSYFLGDYDGSLYDEYTSERMIIISKKQGVEITN